MKIASIRLFLLALIISFAASCGGDSSPTPPDPPTAEEIALEKLVGASGSQNWGIIGGGSVTRDGRIVTDLYENFELLMRGNATSKTYSSLNNNDLFDASGNWSFTSTNFDKFQLTGTKPAAGREITFTQTGENLRLDFTIPAPGARINGTFAIAGSYTFNLLKK